MKIHIQLTEDDLKRLIIAELSETTGIALSKKDVRIEVKSAQNRRSEWETAEFRAIYESTH